MFRLVFEEGSELHGLEIDVRAMRLGEVRTFLSNYPDSGDKWVRVDYELKEFTSRIDSWNLSDDQEKVLPISPEAMQAELDNEDIRGILRTWLAKCLGNKVDNPLGLTSSDGDNTEETHPTEEQTLPMEAL